MEFPDKLTRSERTIAGILLTGKSNKEIADGLFITEKTVKFHVGNIYKKCEVCRRAQFISKYLRETALEILQNNLVEVKDQVYDEIHDGGLPVGNWPLKQPL